MKTGNNCIPAYEEERKDARDYIQSPEKNIIATYKKEQKDTKECIQSLEQNMVTTYEKKRVPSYSRNLVMKNNVKTNI